MIEKKRRGFYWYHHPGDEIKIQPVLVYGGHVYDGNSQSVLDLWPGAFEPMASNPRDEPGVDPDTLTDRQIALMARDLAPVIRHYQSTKTEDQIGHGKAWLLSSMLDSFCSMMESGYLDRPSLAQVPEDWDGKSDFWCPHCMARVPYASEGVEEFTVGGIPLAPGSASWPHCICPTCGDCCACSKSTEAENSLLIDGVKQ